MRRLTASLLNINQAHMTIDMLDKLARLSASGWEIQMILLDNGSERDQVQQLSEWCYAARDRFAELLLISASRNLGANGGRNVALKLAQAGQILIMDNDLILPDDPGWLETLWQTMQDHPHAGIVGPMLVFGDHPEIVQGAGIGLTARGRVGYLNRAASVDSVPPTTVQVVASPAACWLVRREAQQAVGLLSDEFYPMQYWDVDFCVRLGLAGWQILCDRSVKIRHIENVTTRNLKDHPYARVAVRHGLQFREKWADILPRLATITDQDIYWGPIPRPQG